MRSPPWSLRTVRVWPQRFPSNSVATAASQCVRGLWSSRLFMLMQPEILDAICLLHLFL